MRAAVPVLISALVLVAACNRQPDETVAPVPPPTAQTAKALMGEAERAAADAQARSGPMPQVQSSTNTQGETK